MLGSSSGSFLTQMEGRGCMGVAEFGTASERASEGASEQVTTLSFVIRGSCGVLHGEDIGVLADGG